MIEIRRWDNDEIIYSGEYETIKECLESGVRKGVSFRFAKLNGAKLNGAQLNGAKLNGAKLNGAQLNGAELNGAKLNDAQLNRAQLNRAQLNRAQFSETTISIQSGEDYWLFLSEQVVAAGCKSFSANEWRSKTKEEVCIMDGDRAIKFYPRLLDLMDFFLGEGKRPDWVK
jgi:hypothetical protein